MNERERILELVRKGVLTTEEALVLLENIATTQATSQMKKNEQQVTNDDKEFEGFSTTSFKREEEEPFEAYEETKKTDQGIFETILESLTEQINEHSASLDQTVEKMNQTKQKLREKQEQLMVLNTKDELEALTEEELEHRQEIEEEIQDLEEKLSDLKDEKEELEVELKLSRQEYHEQKEDFESDYGSGQEDWKEQLTDGFSQFSEKMTETGTQFGEYLKKTFQSLSETVTENVEWKNVNFKIPGIATSKLSKTYTFKALEATLLDVKVANGNVTLCIWDEPTIKIDAEIKLYGKMDAPSPLAAFEQRSRIDVDEETITLNIPNKRVRADLNVYLPAQLYDHVSVKLLNGNISLCGMQMKDVYLKTTNGQITVEKIAASMLEIEGVNGNIEIKSSDIMDSIVETVNGDVIVTTTPQTLGISLVNGDVRATFKEKNLANLQVTIVNGNIKVALPESLGFEGIAKTSVGNIHSRIEEYEIIRQKKERMNRLLNFRRMSDQMAQIDLNTTSGSIYLKDTDL